MSSSDSSAPSETVESLVTTAAAAAKRPAPGAAMADVMSRPVAQAEPTARTRATKAPASDRLRGRAGEPAGRPGGNDAPRQRPSAGAERLQRDPEHHAANPVRRSAIASA